MIRTGVLVHACSECGAEAPERLPGVLPMGWEPTDPSNAGAGVTCSGCIAVLLAQIVDEMRRVFAGANTRPARPATSR